MVAADEYGLGPVQKIERDPVLERAVALIQQTFPGTVEIEDGALAASKPPPSTKPPERREPVLTSSAPQPTPAPASPPPADDGRETLLPILKQLMNDAFSTGPNRGAAGPWLKARMQTMNVARVADLNVEQLHRMCEELEDKIQLQRGSKG